MSNTLSSWRGYVAVGLGGMIGASLRYGISVLFDNNGAFPFDTLLVNLLGCFMLSFILHQVNLKLNKVVLTGLTTGVIGSFTTFSTFSIETVTLFSSNIFLAFLYVLISMVGGISLCIAGYSLATKRQESK